jgi:hypothetical protein
MIQHPKLKLLQPIEVETEPFVRVENSNGCFSTAQLNLNVSTTQIPNTFKGCLNPAMFILIQLKMIPMAFLRLILVLQHLT